MMTMGKLLKLTLQSLLGLVVTIILIVAAVFVPSSVAVTPAEKVIQSGYSPLLKAEDVNKRWQIGEGSSVYATVKLADKPINVEFPSVQGDLDFFTVNPDQIKGSAKVDVRSVKSGLWLRNAAIKGGNLLDAAHFPEASFQLEKIEKWPDVWQQGKPTSFTMNGVITIKGISKQVSFDCEALFTKKQLVLKADTAAQLQDFNIDKASLGSLQLQDELQFHARLILTEKDYQPVTQPVLAQADKTAGFDAPTRYQANVTVNWENKKLAGSMNVTTKNDTGKAQNDIYFHIYPNQFRNTEALDSPNWKQLLGDNADSGWIDIKRVKVNGQEVAANVQETILQVPVKDWKPGETEAVDMEFEIKLPKNKSTLSYDDHVMWLGNWLPIRAVYEDNGWKLDPYYGMGDPFYSDIANYQVNITAPKKFLVASSGMQTGKSANGETQTYTMTANQVRDFAAVIMDDTYQVIQDQVGHVTVNTWYSKADDFDEVKKLHAVGMRSLNYYSQNFGEYPYSEYDMVSTGGYFGGMEYPGLVFIQDIYYLKPQFRSAHVIAHETAHQWWYGMVGSDEVNEPWLDESLTEYSAVRFLLDQYPDLGRDTLYMNKNNMQTLAQAEKNGEVVSSPVTKFSTWNNYSWLVYSKGSDMWYELEQGVGRDKMNQALQQYFASNKFKNAHSKDLTGAFASVLGPKVNQYFDAWLHGGKTSFNDGK